MKQSVKQINNPKKWTEYEILYHVTSLREAQKEEDTVPLVLRSQINDLEFELYQDGYKYLEISKFLSMGKCMGIQSSQTKEYFQKRRQVNRLRT